MEMVGDLYASAQVRKEIDELLIQTTRTLCQQLKTMVNSFPAYPGCLDSLIKGEDQGVTIYFGVVT